MIGETPFWVTGIGSHEWVGKGVRQDAMVYPNLQTLSEALKSQIVIN